MTSPKGALHSWRPSERSGLLDECAICSMERSQDPHAHPPGARYWMPGLLGHAADSVLRPSLTSLRFDMLAWSGMGQRLFVLWSLAQNPPEDCLLALDYTRGSRPRTETRILLPCPGQRTADWRAHWLHHLSNLIAAAQGTACGRCRAQPGNWCRTPSHHGVPGLHRERLRLTAEVAA